MAKYHIKSDGTPGKCQAVKYCKYGKEDVHFNSLERAQAYADRLNEDEYTVLEEFKSTIIKFRNNKSLSHKIISLLNLVKTLLNKTITVQDRFFLNQQIKLLSTEVNKSLSNKINIDEDKIRLIIQETEQNILGEIKTKYSDKNNKSVVPKKKITLKEKVIIKKIGYNINNKANITPQHLQKTLKINSSEFKRKNRIKRKNN